LQLKHRHFLISFKNEVACVAILLPHSKSSPSLPQSAASLQNSTTNSRNIHPEITLTSPFVYKKMLFIPMRTSRFKNLQDQDHATLRRIPHTDSHKTRVHKCLLRPSVHALMPPAAEATLTSLVRRGVRRRTAPRSAVPRIITAAR